MIFLQVQVPLCQLAINWKRSKYQRYKDNFWACPNFLIKAQQFFYQTIFCNPKRLNKHWNFCSILLSMCLDVVLSIQFLVEIINADPQSVLVEKVLLYDIYRRQKILCLYSKNSFFTLGNEKILYSFLENLTSSLIIITKKCIL